MLRVSDNDGPDLLTHWCDLCLDTCTDNSRALQQFIEIRRAARADAAGVAHVHVEA